MEEFELEGDKVTYEIADREIREWLKEKKRVKDSKLDDDTISPLVEALMGGEIEIQGDRLVVNLNVPIGESGQIKKLEFNPRISLRDARQRMPKKSTNYIDDKFLSYLSAAVNKPISLLEGMDSTDWTLCSSIVGFYM